MGSWGGFDSNPYKGDGTLEVKKGWRNNVVSNDTPHLLRAMCLLLYGVNL